MQFTPFFYVCVELWELYINSILLWHSSHFTVLRLGLVWRRSRALDAPSTVMNLNTRSRSFRPDRECRTDSRSATRSSYSEQLQGNKNKTKYLMFCLSLHTNASQVQNYFLTIHLRLSAGCSFERIFSSQCFCCQPPLLLWWWCKEARCVLEFQRGWCQSHRYNSHGYIQQTICKRRQNDYDYTDQSQNALRIA